MPWALSQRLHRLRDGLKQRLRPGCTLADAGRNRSHAWNQRRTEHMRSLQWNHLAAVLRCSEQRRRGAAVVIIPLDIVVRKFMRCSNVITTDQWGTVVRKFLSTAFTIFTITHCRRLQREGAGIMSPTSASL